MQQIKVKHILPEHVSNSVEEEIKRLEERLEFLEELERMIKDTALLMEQYNEITWKGTISPNTDTLLWTDVLLGESTDT